MFNHNLLQDDHSHCLQNKLQKIHFLLIQVVDAVTESRIFKSIKMKNQVIWLNPVVSCGCWDRLNNLQLYQDEEFNFVTEYLLFSCKLWFL